MSLPRALRSPLSSLGVLLSVLAVVTAGPGLVSSAEARTGRTTMGGWSTTGLVLVQGQERDLHLVLRGASRAGRTVTLQARAAGGAWSAVDRTTSGRRGAVRLDVPSAAPFEGSLRVVVGRARRAWGTVTTPRRLVVGAPAPSGPAPAPSPAPATAGAMTEAETEVLRLVNVARATARTCGDTAYPAVAPLRAEPRLTLASRAHARDMGVNGYFSHDSADGRTPWDRARAAGYPSASGENIAAGYRNPADVVAGWLRSSGHCRNIMAPARDLGVGLAEVAGSRYGSYWVQVFGRG